MANFCDHTNLTRPQNNHPSIHIHVVLTRVALLGVAFACFIVELGFEPTPIPLGWLRSIELAMVGLYCLDRWVGQRLGRIPLTGQDTRILDAILTALAIIGVVAYFTTHSHNTIIPGFAMMTPLFTFKAAAAGMLILELVRLNVVLSRRFYRPGVLLPGSFLAMIIVGTLLLKLPVAIPPGQSISWVDSLFTMTSAVCVTGLAVRDTATQFTPAGQFMIALFIQLGGLGILVFGSLLTMLLGMRLSLRENMTLGQVLHEQPAKQTVSLIKFIVGTTLLFELLGALAMWAMWPGDTPWQERVGFSLFHAISAYCNAGFSLHFDSMVSYRHTAVVHLVILPLIVVGGLGYPVIHNLWTMGKSRIAGLFRKKQSVTKFGVAVDLTKTRLSLHTKLVLVTTAVLYIYGVAGIAVGQFKPHANELFQQGQTANQKQSSGIDLATTTETLSDASFMSISARTAGFNAMPMEQLSPTGRFVVMSLMLIGASPGGTGGGMKTTTFVLLALTVVATARNRETTEAYGRTIGDVVIRKAATVAVSFLLLIAVATGLLTLSEPYPFGKILFEAISAASTTGLSLGITGDLTLAGKLVIIATMFLGRVGPLALLAILFFGSKPTQPYSYPRENVYLS